METRYRQTLNVSEYPIKTFLLEKDKQCDFWFQLDLFQNLLKKMAASLFRYTVARDGDDRCKNFCLLGQVLASVHIK